MTTCTTWWKSSTQSAAVIGLRGLPYSTPCGECKIWRWPMASGVACLILIHIDWYWMDIDSYWLIFHWKWVDIELILIDIDWYEIDIALVLIDIELILNWYWFKLLDIDWYWLILSWYWIDIELILIDIDWYWIDINWYWFILINIELILIHVD